MLSTTHLYSLVDVLHYGLELATVHWLSLQHTRNQWLPWVPVIINSTLVVSTTYLYSLVIVCHRVPGITTAHLLSQRRDGDLWLMFTFVRCFSTALGLFQLHIGNCWQLLAVVFSVWNQHNRCFNNASAFIN